MNTEATSATGGQADHGERFACLCCGHLTLDEPPGGTFNICPVCFWEDDDVQADDPEFAGGANNLSLNEARRNFRAYRSSDATGKSSVRAPRADEIP